MRMRRRRAGVRENPAPVRETPMLPVRENVRVIPPPARVPVLRSVRGFDPDEG